MCITVRYTLSCVLLPQYYDANRRIFLKRGAVLRVYILIGVMYGIALQLELRHVLAALRNTMLRSTQTAAAVRTE